MLYSIIYFSTLTETFTEDEFLSNSIPKQFLTVGELDEYWDWMFTSFYPHAFGREWYNGKLVNSTSAFQNDQDSNSESNEDDNQNNNNYKDNDGYILFANKIVGAVRIRQVRVQKRDCNLPHALSGYVATCYPAYSSGSEEKDDFIPQHANSSDIVYQYSKESELSGFYYWGEVAIYEGGGIQIIARTL